MAGKPRVEHIGIECERFAQIVERQMTTADAVVAPQHFAEDRLRSRGELRELTGRHNGVPALRLGVASSRSRCADPADEHRLYVSVKTHVHPFEMAGPG